MATGGLWAGNEQCGFACFDVAGEKESLTKMSVITVLNSY